MKMNFYRILVAVAFITGVTTISLSQENEAPANIYRDSIPKPRYTLTYPELPHPDPTPTVPETSPITVDTFKSTEINSAGTKPDPVVSSLSDSTKTESLGVKQDDLNTPVTESSLPVSESGLPVSESGLPVTIPNNSQIGESGLPVTIPNNSQVGESGLPVTMPSKSQVGESGLPVSSQAINPISERESNNQISPVSESGLPVTQDKPVNEIKSTDSNPSLLESSGTFEPESQSNHPVSTSRYVDPESKNHQAKTSPEGTRHDWSNAPGFVGYAQNKNVKMEKHVMKTKKHKYRPHHKYQHKTHYRSPKF